MDGIQKADIAVVGGGAAGLMAAGQAAKLLRNKNRSNSVVVLESAPRVGKKLLATGNGRCNLTNMQASPAFYHGAVRKAAPVLELCTPQKVIETFAQMGLCCREEEQGRVYPQNGQASAVLDALRLFNEINGVREVCDTQITGILRRNRGFLLKTAAGSTLQARRLIVAQGGKASPQLGSDGGISLPGMLGHTVSQQFPALVQIAVPYERARPLKGIRSAGVVTLLADGRPVRSEPGEIQFTEWGLSGVCVFQISRLASEFYSLGTVAGQRCTQVSLSVDLLPNLDFVQTTQLIERLVRLYPALPARELLFGVLNKRLGQTVVKTALADIAGMPAGSLTQKQIKVLAHTMKQFVFPATGVLSWKQAQVTAGGVPLDEVLIPSLESAICKGLFLAGEMLDIDGDCGGFNLHWAWASGIQAGKSAAQSLLEE